jgi:hypothetical protein
MRGRGGGGREAAFMLTLFFFLDFLLPLFSLLLFAFGRERGNRERSEGGRMRDFLLFCFFPF